MSKKTVQKERPSDLEGVLAQIRKEFGEGAIMRMGDDAFKRDVPSVSTGSFSLDMALGIGGLPGGRVIEIYGPESSGKTTVAQHLVANVQKAGGTAAFVDADYV